MTKIILCVIVYIEVEEREKIKLKTFSTPLDKTMIIWYNEITKKEKERKKKMKDYKNSKRFAEYLEELTDHEVYDILNDYFVQTENYGDMVYYMQDFSTVFNDTDAYDLARMVYKGDFRPTDEYFLFDTRGNIQSLSARDLKGQLETFVDELVEYGCFNSILKYFEKEEGGN